MISYHSCFKQNIEALYKTNPVLAGQLKILPLNTLSLRLINSKIKGYPTLLLNRNKVQHSSLDPLSDQNFQKKNPTGKKMVFPIFIGTGCAYYIAEILNTNKQDIKKIWIIEKNIEVFRIFLEVVDISFWILSGKLNIFCGYTESEFYVVILNKILEGGEIAFTKIFQLIIEPFWAIIEEKYYLEITGKISGAFQTGLAGIGNDPEDTLIGLKNLIENFDIVAKNPGISVLKDQFRDVPAIVVAAGPSLDQDLEFLQRVRNNCLVISCDTGLRILQKRGIAPDFVTTLERIELASALFEGFEEKYLRNTYLCAFPVVLRKTFQYFGLNHNTFIPFNELTYYDWLGIEKGRFFSVSSSATMAFSLACYLGCNTIMLLGQDLCFGEDGKTHSSHSKYGEIQENSHKRKKMQVTCNDGKKRETNDIWMRFLREYQEKIFLWKGKCITCAEKGAKIQGTEYLSFEKCGDRIPDQLYNPNDRIKQIYSNSIPSEKFSLETEKILSSQLENTIKWIQKKEEWLESKLQWIKENRLSVEPVALYSILENDLRCFHETLSENLFAEFLLRSNVVQLTIDFMEIESKLFSSKEEKARELIEKILFKAFQNYFNVIHLSRLSLESLI